MNITSEQYKFSLRKSGVLDNETYRAILSTQYAAAGGKITANQLSDLLGEKRWSVINLRYGEIGHKLSDAIGVLPRQGRDGKFWWWNMLSDGEQTEQGFIWTIWPALARALEELQVVSLTEVVLLEEIEIKVSEGSKSQVTVNRYERSAVARRHCIKYHGTKCSICGFDFMVVYGTIGDGFIHVHHLIELSIISKDYEVNPIKDLRPVCANCHAMLHRKSPAYSIEELQQIIAQQSTALTGDSAALHPRQ